MKFKIHGIFLSLFFALVLGFSFSIETSAHQYTDSDGNIYTHDEEINVSAAGVGPADEPQMKKFVRHTAKHMDLIDKQENLDETKQEISREIAIFANKVLERAEEGEEPNVLNHGDVYPITTLVNLKGVIGNHGLHPNLLGRKYDSSEDPLKTLLGADIPEFSDDVTPLCVTYDNGGSRVACAVTLIPEQLRAGPITVVAGFHHAEEKPPFVQEPDCSDFVPTVTAQRLENETDPVRKKELLKQFVKSTINITTKIFVDAAKEILEEAQGQPAEELLSFIMARETEPIVKFFDKAPCFREPDLRHGSIYAFIMDPVSGVAFLSGNDFTRNGLSVSLNDPNPVPYDDDGNTEPNILTLIHRTLLTDTDTPTGPLTESDINSIEHGDSGFFTYHWAHPDRSLGLNTPDYLDRCVVPGRALKQSYIEAADVFNDPSLPPSLRGAAFFVFGSGIYLEEDMIPDESMENLCPGAATDDGDDGCAIAAADNTPQSALFNLFLIASVLFSAVLLRKRV